MNREGLLKALKAVIPGVAKGEPLLPGADAFVFRGGLIQSYSDSLSVTFPLDIGVEGSVRAIEMVRVLEKMSGIEVKIEDKENSIALTDGVTTLTMKKINTDVGELIAGLNLEELEWDELPKDFTKALALCQIAVSRNVTHGSLTGIRVQDQDVISSDNFRANWVALSAPMKPFTLPGAAVKDLLGLPDLEQYSVTESWVHFLSKAGAVFSSRLIASEFPTEPLKGMFPKDDGEDNYELPAGLEKALERAGVMSFTQEDGMDYVTLEAKGKDLVITGERQFGQVREKVGLKDGQCPDGFGINIQPGYLLDILGKTRTFRMAGKLVYFHGEGFKHIIAPIIKE